ncbi:MAG: ABC transporter substrate-binding protein [Lachnospiraceae bacterium]|nr:ABC transporter substrate-binding protein [Lachnospiraceae bacterium]
MRLKRKVFLLIAGLLILNGCSSPDSSYEEKNDKKVKLEYESSMEVEYAKGFKVDYYKEGYKVLTVNEAKTSYIVIPEGKKVPDDIDKDMVVINQPLKDIYMVSTGVMDMFAGLDAMDLITFSSKKADEWYVDKAKEEMENGNIVYAGKYSKPDYELLVAKNCRLAIENTMISHSPQVIEKMESFNIPVLIEYASYEDHPLGRVEWIKFFGALTDKEDKAKDVFNIQKEKVNKVIEDTKTGKTVVFFYVTSNGLISTRTSSDYIAKMIELAGGTYLPEDVKSDTKKASINMPVEEFYNKGKDADYIIYSSAIDGGVKSVDELVKKCDVIKNFKAVKDGNVWCTTSDMYQQSLSAGDMISDIHNMLTGKDEEMVYLFKLK